MSLSGNQLHYFLSYTTALIGFVFVDRSYLWPAPKNQPQTAALPPFLLYASLRLNGLIFLILGFCSTRLRKAFANTFQIAGCANSLSRAATGAIACAQWS